ncbi:hypothetical protein P3T35_003041 [Kitasatospora sp. GP30]|uniref:hypothetical protein n=1 Tax=Kitasatospora sp. GP30 TaxID=3035084 RepID=UPI000CAA8F3F|nr:hypothetical protein [Kitasatospora sp. GP30]MDH6141028.1 hypothetical protein [Kitasatospora sp. GP30]
MTSTDDTQRPPNWPSCYGCGTLFDPDDKRPDGHARHSLSDYCRSCWAKTH